MTRQEKIEQLQDQVQHNRIPNYELQEKCEQYDIDLHDEVLFPIGYNTCDRCGSYGDSEVDFVWLDCIDWQDDDPKDQAVLRALEQEGIDYCAICWDCLNELQKKGEEK